MKFKIILIDPPWSFSDSLKMTDTKRGASSHYNVMSISELKKLPIKNISEDDSVLLMWCPSSLIPEGLILMKEWGFDFKQTHVWVKTKKEPFKSFISLMFKSLLSLKKENIKDFIFKFDINSILGFGMGRLFRQSHEIVLIGTKGKIYNFLKNKSQRSVHLSPVTKHSKKPENLQDMLDVMFPNSNKIEIFARRDRNGWVCVGLECPSTIDQKIQDSLKNIMDENEK